MTTRKITITAIIAGIVLGAAVTEGFNIYRQSHDSQIFQERLRCKAVADAYVKENSTDENRTGRFVILHRVDYSPVRNSCVADLEHSFGPLITENVVDLLSGETLFSVNCPKGCKTQVFFVEPAFDYVMKNATKPYDKYLLELEKSAWDVEHPPKSPPPSGGR